MDELREVLKSNADYAYNYILEHFKAGVAVGVIWQDGRPFHRPYAIRLNLALPHVLVKEAFDRMDKYVFNAK